MSVDKEYVDFLIKKTIENKIISDEIQGNRKTVLMFLTFLVLTSLGVLGMKYTIEHNISHQINDSIENSFSIKYEDMISKKLLYIDIVNDLAAISNIIEPSETEVDELLDKIYQLETGYEQDPEINIEALIFRLSSFVAQAGHIKYLMQISALFQDVIISSKRLNNIFVNYHGKKVLSLTNESQNEYLKNYYNKFNEHVEHSKALGDDVRILPMLTLVTFHITGQMRSTNCDKLINYISQLAAPDKAQFMLALVMNKSGQDSIENYTISQVTERFMTVYKNELEQISYSSGVKEFIVQKYKTVGSDKEIGKYRQALNDLYNFGL